MEKELLQNKAFDFAVNIINICKQIIADKKEYILTKQLIRSGTSIGANIEEAIGSYSKMEFKHKFSISYKEARESEYWLRLMRKTDYLTESEYIVLAAQCKEISAILFKSIQTISNNINKEKNVSKSK